MTDARPGAIDFGRLPGEIYGWLVLGIILLIAIVFLLWKVAGLIVLLLSDHSAGAMWAYLMAVPLIAFCGFMLYLVGMGVKTFRRAFADRHLPLVTLGVEGVALTRATLMPKGELWGGCSPRRTATSMMAVVGVELPLVARLSSESLRRLRRPVAAKPTRNEGVPALTGRYRCSLTIGVLAPTRMGLLDYPHALWLKKNLLCNRRFKTLTERFRVTISIL